jgi:hypothetical protein
MGKQLGLEHGTYLLIEMAEMGNGTVALWAGDTVRLPTRLDILEPVR